MTSRFSKIFKLPRKETSPTTRRSSHQPPVLDSDDERRYSVLERAERESVILYLEERVESTRRGEQRILEARQRRDRQARRRELDEAGNQELDGPKAGERNGEVNEATELGRRMRQQRTRYPTKEQQQALGDLERHEAIFGRIPERKNILPSSNDTPNHNAPSDGTPGSQVSPGNTRLDTRRESPSWWVGHLGARTTRTLSDFTILTGSAAATYGNITKPALTRPSTYTQVQTMEHGGIEPQQQHEEGNPGISQPRETIPQATFIQEMKEASPSGGVVIPQQTQGLVMHNIADSNEQVAEKSARQTGGLVPSDDVGSQPGERGNVHPPGSQLIDDQKSDAKRDGGNEIKAYEPGAFSAIDYEQVLMDINSSDRLPDDKLDMTIELISLLREHKVELIRCMARDKAEKQTEIERLVNFYRTRPDDSNEGPVHPNSALIERCKLLLKDDPSMEFVICQLRQGIETTNKGRYQIQDMEQVRKPSQADTLVENERRSYSWSGKSQEGRKTRKTSQSWKATQPLVKASRRLNSIWKSQRRSIGGRTSVQDPRLFKPDAPQTTVVRDPDSGVAIRHKKVIGSTQAIHSAQKVPAVNNPQLTTNAAIGVTESGTSSANTPDVHTNNNQTQAQNLNTGIQGWLNAVPEPSESVAQVAR